MPQPGLRLARLQRGEAASPPRVHVDPSTVLRCPVDEDVFVVREPSRWFFFAPRSRSYCAAPPEIAQAVLSFGAGRTTHEVVAEHGLDGEVVPALEALVRSGVLRLADEGRAHPGAPAFRERRPTLFVVPTNDCNLRCRYCYASAGDLDPHYIDEARFTAAVRGFVRANLDRANEMLLVFHGGGEPTIRPRLLRGIVEAFDRACRGVLITPYFSLVTNGCFGAEARALLTEHDFRVQVSLDGLRDVQDYQRPMRAGGGSFDRIVENVRFLVAEGRPVTFRSTVTRMSVHSLSDIVGLAADLGVGRVHFEPMFRTGRGLDEALDPPPWEVYTDELRRAFLRGAAVGVEVQASDLVALYPPKTHFCGACGWNVIVTPEGLVSTCEHVLDPDDPAADPFLVGTVDVEKERIDYRPGSIELLRSRVAGRMPGCRDCFLAATCAGDCPIRAHRVHGDIFGVRPDACDARRSLGAWAIGWVALGGDPPGETVAREDFELAAHRDRLSASLP